MGAPVHRDGPRSRRASAGQRRLIATISDPTGTRIVLGAPTVDDLYRRVAAHVAGRAAFVLWPEPARRVRRLRAQRRWRSAVETYFAHVGHRWDPEWLAIHRVDG